jgi:N-acetylglutamate synthase-like GNAT family acetyltransferase
VRRALISGLLQGGPAAGVRVRPAVQDDHAAVLALLRDLELDYPARDLARFHVAERGGEIVGVAELKASDGIGLLSCVGVREDLQGQGIGREIVARVLVGVGIDVYLYTLVPGFFAKLGFVDDPAPPQRLPPRRIHGCEACDPAACRCMVRRAHA